MGVLPVVEQHAAYKDPDGLALRCSCENWAMLFKNYFGRDPEHEHSHHARYARLETELAAIDKALREAGIEYPLGAGGVTDLAAMASGRLEELQTAEATLIAARRLVEHWDRRPERSVAYAEAGERAKAMLTHAVRNLPA